MSIIQSREIHRKSRPQGTPVLTDFELVEAKLSPLRDGEILVRNEWISVDPYMRGRMNDRASYVEPFQLGQPMEGGCVGKVVASRNPSFCEGDCVLGMTGMTAYVGLLKIGALKPGENVFVSAASGAVGSIVGQIAKFKQCRVVGSAGSDEKITWLKSEAGFDEAFNYHDVGDVYGELAELFPGASPYISTTLAAITWPEPSAT